MEQERRERMRLEQENQEESNMTVRSQSMGTIGSKGFFFNQERITTALYSNSIPSSK